MAGCTDAPSADDRQGASSAEYESAIVDKLGNPGTPSPGGESDHDRGQRFLVDCMAQSGFTYHVAQPPKTQYESLGLTDRQFKLKYGWGLSTLIDRQQADLAATPQNPNEREQASMSDAQRAAYGKAMSECQRQMLIKIGVMPPRLSLPSGSRLSAAINAATEAASADRRVADVKARWASCMRDQGFDYARGEQLQESIVSRVEPLRQAYVARGQVLVNQGSSRARLTVKDVLTAEQLRQLNSVQVFELSAAAADAACQDQGIDVAAVSAQVQSEYLRRAMESF